MKKLRLFVILSLIIGAFFALCSCGGGKELSTPSGISIDQDHLLSWTKIEDADGYVVDVKNSDSGESTQLKPKKKNTSVSLSDLEEGDYEIRIKAVGDGDIFQDSEWSVTQYYHKDYETGCIYTAINNNTEYELTKYGKAPATIYIEDVYRGKPVTRIAEKAFKGYSRIENVTIGNNVKSIGDSAFHNCKKLKSITIPESVTSIGMSAFQSCVLLEEINIPKSVTEIGDYTFAYCRGLQELELHDELTKIGEYAFSDCSSLQTLTIPDSVTELGLSVFTGATSLQTLTIGKGLTEIPDSTFYMCSALQTINFPEGGALETIADNAFSECIALESVTLPEGLVTIGNWAFCMRGEEETDENDNEIIVYNSVLESVSIPSTVTRVGENAFYGAKFYVDAMEAGDPYIYADEWLVGCSATIKEELVEITISSLKEGIVGIADAVFENCAALTSVKLPYSVKYLGNSAFQGNKKLYQLETYENSLQIIGDYAFMDCEILSRITLSNGIERIGAYAFYNCERIKNNELQETLIPDSVTSIGTYAFNNTGLWNEPDEFGIVYAGNWVVGFNTANGSITTVELGEDTVGIADYAFYQCETLSAVTGLSYVSYIGRAAFFGCTKLDNVVLGRSVTKIEDYTFYKCSSLYSVDLPRSLTSIGRSAFYKCEQLREIDLSGTSVETIGEYAFYNCINLQEVDLGEDLIELKEYAFYKCAALTEVTIPDGVTTIGNRAFYHCDELQVVNLGEGVVTIEEYAFASCAKLRKVTFTDSVKEIEKYAFYRCSSIVNLNLGNSVETVGDFAFYGLEKVKTLNLPESLKSIGRYAFKGFKQLNSLLLTTEVEELGAHAFYSGKDVDLTVYTDAESILGKWDKHWNSSYRPVVWGCNLSEDNTYVVSVTIEEGTLQNVKAKGGFTGPERSGYKFAGWATAENGEVVYTAAQITEVAEGTTLYAVWQVEGSEPETTPEVPEAPEGSESGSAPEENA